MKWNLIGHKWVKVVQICVNYFILSYYSEGCWPAIILEISERPGFRGFLTYEPTAIRAWKVLELILCCMKFTWRRPVENARSASTDVAVYMVR